MQIKLYLGHCHLGFANLGLGRVHSRPDRNEEQRMVRKNGFFSLKICKDVQKINLDFKMIWI